MFYRKSLLKNNHYWNICFNSGYYFNSGCVHFWNAFSFTIEIMISIEVVILIVIATIHTFPASFRLVSMTIACTSSCQTILQKSSRVFCLGPVKHWRASFFLNLENHVFNFVKALNDIISIICMAMQFFIWSENITVTNN